MKKHNLFSKKNKNVEKAENPTTEVTVQSTDILLDPEYLSLSSEFQKGHWGECQRIIDSLDKKFPGDPRLEEFKNEFNLRYSVIKNIELTTKEKNKKSLVSNFKGIAIIFGVLVAIGLVIWIGFTLIQNYSQTSQIQNNQNKIRILATQAENLITSGQPEKASEIVVLMKNIDANNSIVIDLSKKTDEILKINNEYLSALDKLKLDQDSDALQILQQIDKEYPDYRDVPQLIEETSKRISINKAVTTGTQAYKENDWQKTITNFEQIQSLDPTNIDPSIKDMLLNSYLRRIIQLLESNNTTFDEIDQAEVYYRRASAMIPQSKIYLSERENLQKISSNLLVMKYTQSAYSIVIEPDQTLGMVNQAVIYLKKAANLDPNNPTIQSELDKITLYQAGFQYYLGMNWPSAIEQFSSLNKIDSTYANGFARQLLYEAYIQRGKQYASVGFPADARKQFESAESLSWDKSNLMGLFMVEIDLAQTLGTLEQYKDAASYYKYAVESVNYQGLAASSPAFVNDLTSAAALYDAGNYQDSYTLFNRTLADKNLFFAENEIKVRQGNCLAIIAAINQSSVEAIAEKNNLPQQTIVSVDQTLIIPSIPNR
jgi:tetratricopeptide (TPR) repeat protein